MISPAEIKEQLEVMLAAAGFSLPVKHEEEDGHWWIEIDERIGIEPTERSTRLGSFSYTGWRVYEWKDFPATREDPPDRADITIVDTVSIGTALEQTVLWFVKRELWQAVGIWRASRGQEVG
jgi:hypothetical protein